LLALALNDNPPCKFGRREDSVEGKPASEFFMDDNEALLKVRGTANSERTIKLFAANGENEQNPSGMEISRKQEKGDIILDAGGDATGVIELKVGNSCITITSDEIFIYADKISFGPKDKPVAATLTSDGFKLKTGNMDVDEGSLFVQEGITTEGLVDAKSIKSKSGKIGSYDSK
jgi:hypothetical protein